MKTKWILIAVILMVAIGFLVVNHFVIHVKTPGVGPVMLLYYRARCRVMVIWREWVARREMERIARTIKGNPYEDIFVTIDPNGVVHVTHTP
ncbi:MAG: hypothetical protein GX455_04615 [Phycisphaerae bacterium]|nr:hypothetical protein [Phycisphaerae bacterium]